MKHFQMLIIASVVVLATVEAPSGSASAADISITGTVNSSTLTVSASADRFAGAIDSIMFRGVQYVDTHDHGRLLQSAIVYDPGVGCLNPTEAGSGADGTGSTSQSVLESISNANNVITTTVNAAWYIPPVGGSCDVTGYPVDPSNTIFSKSVTIGYAGVPNLIGYSINAYVPQSQTYADWEVNTAYSPGNNFKTFLTYNPSAKTLAPLTATSNADIPYISTPVIVATSNGENAISAVSPQPGILYGYFYAGGGSATAKQNCFYEASNVVAGTTLSISCPLAIGTVDEVISALNAYPVAQNSDKPVFRFRGASSSQHFYTLSYTEGANAGWLLDGTGFIVYAGSAAGRIELYRCIRSNANDHFASTASNCEGYTLEGVFGYIDSSLQPGDSTLYRFYNGKNDHLVTTSYTEGVNAGYTYEGILGYTPPS